MATISNKGNSKAYAGWSTLNKKDALLSVRDGLRRYSLDNSLLSLNSRRFNLEDGEDLNIIVDMTKTHFFNIENGNIL